MEKYAPPIELWEALRQWEDGGGQAVSSVIPRKDHAFEVYPRPAHALQKGALFFEEVAEVLALVRGLPESPERNLAEACLLLAAAFGMPIEGLHTAACPITSNEWCDPLNVDSAPSKPGLLLCKPPEIGTWQGVMVLALGGELPMPPAGANHGWLHPISPLAPVALSASLAQRIAELLQNHPQVQLVAPQGRLKRLQWPPTLLCQELVDDVLAQVRAMAPRMHCTSDRVANALHQVMRERRVDPAIRGLLGGTWHRGAAIACYYTAVRVQAISNVLLDAQSELSSLLSLPACPLQDIAPRPCLRVGSRRVPHRKATRKAIEAMEEHVRSSRALARHGLAGLVREHNALVNDLAFQIYVACGVRPAKNGLPNSNLGSGDRTSFCICDKGVPSRELPLTDAVKASLDALEASIQRLGGVATVLFHRQLAREVMQLGYEPTQPRRPNGNFLLLGLDADNRVTLRQWEPTDLAACLSGLGIGVPIGLWRHALRSDLLELEIDPSDIDAILGHFQVGRETWAKTSFKIAADHLPHLKAILERRLAWVRG